MVESLTFTYSLDCIYLGEGASRSFFGERSRFGEFERLLYALVASSVTDPLIIFTVASGSNSRSLCFYATPFFVGDPDRFV